MKTILILAFVAVATQGTVHFREGFGDETWSSRWLTSKHEGKSFGKFELTPGKFYGDESNNALKTTQDAHFYAISTKFPPFSNQKTPLIIQFSVKHEQNIDCGGGYLKIFDCSLDPEALHGETPYLLMFGPDICGPGTKKVHVIVNYKGKNHLISKDIRCKDDIFTHIYTLTISPDQTYSVLIDNEPAQSGDLTSDWDFLPPKKIPDPAAEKPADWIDVATIPDPDETKPEDWEQPEHVKDPEATKPEDWDDEMDGEWEAPVVDNPEYKGDWKAKLIPNPAFTGPWLHPEIANPDYVEDSEIYRFAEICGVGIDVWQVKSGTLFDNLFIGDDEGEAEEERKRILGEMASEKSMKEGQDAEEKSKEEEKKEAADDEDEDDDDKDKEEHDEL